MTEASMPILETRAISKRFGGVQALDRVSMKVHAGEVVALAGDNGAGKSTLIKTISGVYQPDDGEIVFQGVPTRFETPHHARDSGIETIYQDLALADNLSIGANIFLGREPMRKAFGFLPVLDRPKMAEAARETMARLEFHVTRLDAPVSNFSGGQRQAVAIARAVYFNARILIMDEPTAALGPAETAQVRNLVRQLKEEGIGIFLISHDIHDVFDLSDRISVMYHGKIVDTVDKSSVTADDVLGMIILGKKPDEVTEKDKNLIELRG